MSLRWQAGERQAMRRDGYLFMRTAAAPDSLWKRRRNNGFLRPDLCERAQARISRQGSSRKPEKRPCLCRVGVGVEPGFHQVGSPCGGFRLPWVAGTLTTARAGSLSLRVGSNSPADHAHGRGQRTHFPPRYFNASSRVARRSRPLRSSVSFIPSFSFRSASISSRIVRTSSASSIAASMTTFR